MKPSLQFLLTIFLIGHVYFVGSAYALVPSEILVITNADNPSSIQVANHYCLIRSVPQENLVKLSLGQILNSDISRADYEKLIVNPLRTIIKDRGGIDRIKCLLTTYGVPYRVGGSQPLAGQEKNIAGLEELRTTQLLALDLIWAKANMLDSDINKVSPLSGQVAKRLQTIDEKLKTQLKKVSALPDKNVRKSRTRILTDLFIQFYGPDLAKHAMTALPSDFNSGTDSSELASHKVKLAQAQSDKWDTKTRLQAKYYDSLAIVLGYYRSVNVIESELSYLKGKETSASLDSELAMILFENYELYRWQPNELKERVFWFDIKTMMVSRIDGPTSSIAEALVDKAVAAEKTGLKGNAYFDARGYSGNSAKGLFETYDTRIMACEQIFKSIGWHVMTEQSEALFQPGSCPDAAVYCGWYSLRNYIPAFSFVDGAIGYHIASFEAIDLRDPSSGQWVANLLKDGITATIGAVAEPYLSAFPYPDAFFNQLLAGKPLVEAYCKTNPFNSWQMMLIGDPLYTPFKNN